MSTQRFQLVCESRQIVLNNTQKHLVEYTSLVIFIYDQLLAIFIISLTYSFHYQEKLPIIS